MRLSNCDICKTKLTIYNCQARLDRSAWSHYAAFRLALINIKFWRKIRIWFLFAFKRHLELYYFSHNSLSLVLQEKL